MELTPSDVITLVIAGGTALNTVLNLSQRAAISEMELRLTKTFNGSYVKSDMVKALLDTHAARIEALADKVETLQENGCQHRGEH